MPEIVHNQLSGYLKKSCQASPPAVYLIHGQQALVEQHLGLLTDHLLNGATRDLGCESMDGLLENIPEVLERMNTYSMLAGSAIVVFKDAKLFESESEEGVDNLPQLMRAIEKGFARAHYLIITVYAKVPKNRKFYKTVNAHGLIVDCHVPLGERKADKAVQESVLKGILDDVLKKTGKRIQPKLFSRLQQLTGFDPVTFRNNIEKLIDFTGPRNDITDDDITAVVRRTKSDPLFELTNAVAERDVTTALVLAEGMLGGEWHPLQVLAALANQMRKLLVAKDFAASEEGRTWKPGMGYPQFQSGVLSAIQAYDGRIAERVRAWPKPITAPDDEGKKKGGLKGGMDLALASNPANAYPVFQTLSKSEKYGRKELIEALGRLSEADMRLKSTGQNAALVLRTTIMAICAVRRAGRPPVASDRL